MLSSGKARMFAERLFVEFSLFVLLIVPVLLVTASAFRRQVSWQAALMSCALPFAFYAYGVLEVRRDLALRRRRATYGPSPLAAAAPAWLEHEWYLHPPPELPPSMSLFMRVDGAAALPQKTPTQLEWPELKLDDDTALRFRRYQEEAEKRRREMLSFALFPLVSRPPADFQSPPRPAPPSAGPPPVGD